MASGRAKDRDRARSGQQSHQAAEKVRVERAERCYVETYNDTGVVTGFGAVSDSLTLDIANLGVGLLGTESAPVIDRVQGSKTRVGGLVNGGVELRRAGVGGAVPVGAPDTGVVGARSSVAERRRGRGGLGRGTSGQSDEKSSSSLHLDFV